MQVKIEIKSTRDINKKFSNESNKARHDIDKFIGESKYKIISSVRGGLISGKLYSKDLQGVTIDFESELECENFRKELTEFCEKHSINKYLEIYFLQLSK